MPIDTKALIDGPKSGRIGYAGLDVYEEEAEYFYKDLSDSVITDDALARLTRFGKVMVAGHQGSLTDAAQANVTQPIENIREHEARQARKRADERRGVQALLNDTRGSDHAAEPYVFRYAKDVRRRSAARSRPTAPRRCRSWRRGQSTATARSAATPHHRGGG